MKTVDVIAFSCLPARMPTGTLIALWLLMVHFDAPGWLHGVYWTFATFVVIAFIITLVRQNQRKLPGFGEST